MGWEFMLLIILGSLVILMLTGMPVAFSFVLVNLAGMYIFFGGLSGAELLILSIYSTLATFILSPIPLFILMGEVLFHSGISSDMLEAIDRFIGRIPGRLALIAVAAGTLFSVLTGVSAGSVAMLGSMLVPEMEKRGYKKSMTMGPILGSGGLAIMIPPSALAILLGAIGQISIGKILMAIIIPGLLMAAIIAIYILARCSIQPSVAPAYDVVPSPLSIKLKAGIRHILPVAFIVFLVTGVIFLGIASPEEAAATGAIGMFILCGVQKRLNWGVVKQSVAGTIKVSAMILLIIAGAKAFSQILSFSGATRGLAELAINLPIAPIVIIAIMQIIALILGCFMESASIMMVTLPVFVPTVAALGFDPVWYAVIHLIAIEMGLITPPMGFSLFVMKGVAPKDTTMGEVYLAALPFVFCNLIAMAMIMIFPQIALWLPGSMR